jgi:hypothetical protein
MTETLFCFGLFQINDKFTSACTYFDKVNLIISSENNQILIPVSYPKFYFEFRCAERHKLISKGNDRRSTDPSNKTQLSSYSSEQLKAPSESSLLTSEEKTA